MDLRQLFNSIPGVTKNLLIINVLMFLATKVLQQQGFDMNTTLGLYYVESPHFMPAQLVTYMFLHGGIGHIFFNMFALLMFGGTLEKVWGPKKYLVFYFITGIGAVVLQMIVNYFEIQSDLALFPQEFDIWNNLKGYLEGTVTDTGLNTLVYNAAGSMDMAYSEVGDLTRSLLNRLRTPTVGASGAIFGLLLAFGVLFPNTELMLLFFPVPIKAKYFIPGLIIMELYLGVQQSEFDNVAHFAHLGGALFGYILVKIWQKGKNNFY